MKLVLVRHGMADLPQGRVCGQSDPPLSALGRLQIDALLQRHSGPLPERVFSSDLARAYDSARMFGELHGLPVHRDARLRELDFGRWEGRSWGELPQSDAECFARWVDDWVGIAPPDGESFADLAVRAREWLDEQAALWPEGTLLLVFAHAGVIRALLAQALQMPLREAFALRIDPGRASALQRRYGRHEVCYVNNPRLECDLFGE